MNRRQFTLLALASSLPGLARSSYDLLHQTNKNQTKTFSRMLLGAFDDANGKHFCSRLALHEKNTEFLNIESMQIPFRAHDTLPLSANKSLSFGRRPHNQMIVCDFDSQQQLLINAKKGRHFYGHGCIHKERNTLFTTENDYENGKSVIGIRDSQNFHQIGEFQSYGIGPHDIHLMPDNKTLVIANGGIQTHPDFGRRKLNLKTMRSSLVFINSESGEKIDEYRLDNQKLSIRHLTITPEGSVGIAVQYQNEDQRPHDTPDFLLAWLGENGLQTLNHSQEFTRSCEGYIGDIAVDTNGKILAATSPRGNNISIWDIKDSRLIKTIQISNPSGLCFDQHTQEFLVSNAQGVINKIALDSNLQTSKQLLATQFSVTQLKVFPVKWDNYMMISI